MELTNEFRVDVPLDEAWTVLTDVERIAPCMPGAQLQEIEGDEFRGIVKVKVGPITAQYKGAARFLEKDDAGKKAVLKAEGRDTRGQGNANATITATLQADGTGTAVTVVTDLTVTGKVAQFGRGVLADVSSKLLSQFVECLESDLLAPSSSNGGAAAGAAPAATEPAAPVGASFEPAKGSIAAEAAAPPADAPSGNGAGAAKAAATSTATTTAPSNGQSAGEAAAASQVRKIDSKPAEAVDLLDAAGIPVAKRAIPVVAGVLLLLWFLRRRRRSR